MKRSTVICVFLLLVAIVALSCAPPPAPTTPPQALPAKPAPAKADWEVKWDSLVQEAKKEGEVTFYFIGGPNARQEVAQAFKRRFGINITYVVGAPAELAQKLEQERNAGLYLADLINVGGGSALTMLAPKGLLKPIEPELILPEVKDPKAWRIGKLPLVDSAGLVLGMLANYERYVAINTDLVRDGEITSLRDLLNPKWKGKMIMLDPSMPGAGASVCAFVGRLWGMDEAVNWFQGIARQETVLTRDKRQHVEWVARGSKAIAIAPSPDVLADFKATGAPIASIALKEGGNLQTVGGAITLPAKPGRPSASTVLLNWLLSKEGQAAYVKGIGVPGARVDAPREGIDPFFFPGPGDEITVTGDEEFFLLQGKMRPKLTAITRAAQSK